MTLRACAMIPTHNPDKAKTMCSSPRIPPPPPPPQEVKAPDSGALVDAARKRRNSASASGTLLTGPSGAAPADIGRNTLLGG